MKKWYKLLGLTAAASLALVACGNSDSDSETADSSSSSESGEVVAPELATTVDNEGDAIDGGTLQVGLVTDSPFQGIFSWEFYEDAYDAEIMQSINEAKPIVLTEKKNKLADEISDMVSEELGEKEESSGLSGWFGSLFK